MKKKKILFLYTELAGYFLSCVNALSQIGDFDIYVIRWKVNKEAPFEFSFSDKIKVVERESLKGDKLLNFVSDFAPDVIYCSGWIDKGYVDIAKKFNKQIPVIVGIDNQWVGSLRQQLATIVFRFKYRNAFKYAWVSGKPQRKFAEKLGFKADKIKEGVYSADVDHFESIYAKVKSIKRDNFPKRFLYVGRYYHFKGVVEMWNAFIRLQQQMPNDWELWCLGTGDVQPIDHPKIKHFGFIQPSEIYSYVAKCGVFILPSHFEPWGVVIHEFAAAGFPIICSSKVGAATSFLSEGVNGYIFNAKDEHALMEKMKKMILMSNDELFEMGEQSSKLAKKITPTTWANTITEILK